MTAGPTVEPLDEVRCLTNRSTGRLGWGLAAYLLERGVEVTLLRSTRATWRGAEAFPLVQEFTTSAELRELLANAAGPGVQGVFHVAAVSDFCFGQVYDRAVSGWLVEREERKLESVGGDLLVELRPAPKLIAHLKQWFPGALCVGWKYELDGGREEALGAGRAQLTRYGTGACVVNGAAYGAGYGFLTANALRHCHESLALYQVLWEALERWPG